MTLALAVFGWSCCTWVGLVFLRFRLVCRGDGEKFKVVTLVVAGVTVTVPVLFCAFSQEVTCL